MMPPQQENCLQGDDSILMMNCGLGVSDEESLSFLSNPIETSCCQQHSPRSISCTSIFEASLHDEDMHHFAITDVDGNVEVGIASRLAARLEGCETFGSDAGVADDDHKEEPDDLYNTPNRPKRRSLSHQSPITTTFPSHIPFPSPGELQGEAANTPPPSSEPCTPSSTSSSFYDEGEYRFRAQNLMDCLHKNQMNIGAEQKLMHAAASVGIDSVLNAMRLHQGNDRVQRYGCGALQKLASQNETNRILIVGAGGVVDILAAMNRHADKARIQECGCLGLSTLSKAPHGIAWIVRYEGVETILNALRNHVNNSAVQKQGCLALLCLAGDNAGCNSRIATLGGVQVLMKAISLHLGHTDILKYASAALWSLAYRNPHNLDVIEAQVEGGLDAVLDALSIYQDHNLAHQVTRDDHCLHVVQVHRQKQSFDHYDRLLNVSSPCSVRNHSQGVDAILSVFVRPLQNNYSYY
jgi:hypothetical protein